MIVYNIEEFVVQQMFRPYQSLFPNTETEKGIAEWEELLRDEPLRIMETLRSDNELYTLVFNRLSEMKVSFYKWLNHPVIEVVEYALKRHCAECGSIFPPDIKYYPNRVCTDCLQKKKQQ